MSETITKRDDNHRQEKQQNMIPQAMRAAKQWLCWKYGERDGKKTKIPINPVTFGNTSAPDAAWSYEECRKVSEKAQGIGIGFSLKNGFAGIDYDHVLDSEGKLKNEHAGLMDEIMALDSYTEVSPSGEGLHVIVQYIHRPEACKDGTHTQRGEIYFAGRFLTFTGNIWKESPSRDVQTVSSDLLKRVYDRIAGQPKQAKAPAQGEERKEPAAAPASQPVRKEEELSDAAVIKLVNKRVKGAALWSGDISGYPSASEADAALMCILAYFTRRNHAQMMRIFAKSGLAGREKANRPDYIERTVDFACEVTDKVYQPRNTRAVMIIPPAEEEEDPADPPWNPMRYTSGIACNFTRPPSENECARIFVRLIKDHLKFSYDRAEWYKWDKHHWGPARGIERVAAQMAMHVMRDECLMLGDAIGALFAEKLSQEEIQEQTGVKNPTKTDVSQFKAVSRLLDSSRGINGILKASEVGNGVYIESISKAANHHLLSCQNGIIDTKTGTMIPAGKECEALKGQYPLHYVNRVYSPVNPTKPYEKIPMFMMHLNTVMTNNTTEKMTTQEREDQRAQLVPYFMRMLGYLLTAGNDERIISFWHGEGANGKSATMDIIKGVLGADEVGVVSITQFYANPEDKPAPSVVNALPCRLMVMDEAQGDNGLISAGAIKILTGEKSSVAWRRMRENNEETSIVCKPIANCNHMPHFAGGLDDQALIDRISTIPFMHRFEKKSKILILRSRSSTQKGTLFSLSSSMSCNNTVKKDSSQRLIVQKLQG